MTKLELVVLQDAIRLVESIYLRGDLSPYEQALCQSVNKLLEGDVNRYDFGGIDAY